MPALPPVRVARGGNAVSLIAQAADSARRILDGARRRYTRTALAILDAP